MGYYTAHRLAIDCDDKNKLLAIKAAMKEQDEYFTYALDFEGDEPQSKFNTYEQCKWYSHEKDMRELSAQFPDVLFTLDGEGEESGDIWTEYHKNGKMQRAQAKITRGDFDPEQLE